MNCPNCHDSIPYRFSASCPACNSELAASVPTADLTQSNESHRSLGQYVAGGAMILVMSGVGMLIGAVGIYALAGFIYLPIYSGEVTNGYECARGMAVGWLSLFAGAFLGCSGGAVLGTKILFNNQNDITASSQSRESD